MIKNNQIKDYEYELDYFIGTELVGYLKYEVTFEVVNIIDVFVEENYRNRGIATKLFENLLKNVKPEKFMLEVNENNVNAIKLYKKFGFVNIHVRKKYYKEGDALIMELKKNKDVLEAGNMAGNFFENFVIVEIIKSYYNSGVLQLPIYFYRDKDKREIDLIIEQNGKLHPIEIKKSAKPTKDMIANFKVLDKLGQLGSGAVICMYDNILDLDENNKAIPYMYL